MKIIAHIKTGYLVETTESELANALGFDRAYGDEWDKFKRKHVGYGERAMEIGTTFEIKAAHDFFHSLQSREKQAKDAAGLLRSLADMIDNGLPTLIIAPLDSKPDVVK